MYTLIIIIDELAPNMKITIQTTMMGKFVEVKPVSPVVFVLEFSSLRSLGFHSVAAYVNIELQVP